MKSLFLFFIFFTFGHILLCKLTKFDTKKTIIYIFFLSILIFFDYSKVKNINYMIFFISSKLTFLIIYIEFFSLINRGFTISILTSLDHNKFKLEDIEKKYSGNKGLKWMLQKRINGMLYFHVIKIINTNFKLTIFGKIILHLIKISQKILHVRKLGQ
jgi:hypothetical protein